MTATNIIMDSGGTNQVTVYSIQIEEIVTKQLLPLTFPQSNNNWASGPKDTRILDLLRIVRRFNITGMIDASAKTKFKAITDAGGTFTMAYNSVNYVVNIEKYSLREKPEDKTTAEPRFYDVIFTVIEGTNL